MILFRNRVRNTQTMENYLLSKPIARRKLVSTRRKIKVLSNLQSSYMKQKHVDEDVEMSNVETLLTNGITDHGKEMMSLLQNEQIYIECLKHLSKVLHHPCVIGGLETSGKIIAIVENILSVHEDQYSMLITGKCSLPHALKNYASSLGLYETYSSLIGSNLNFYENISEIYAENGMCFIDILQKPASQVFWFKNWLQKLLKISSNKIYHDVYSAFAKSCEKIHAESSARKNALRILQIQKLLLHRKPKIVCSSRIIIKEGILYKVNLKGSGMKKLACFLFNDMFLFCKIISKSFDWQKRDSLSFYALLPLNMCSVSSIMGSSNQGALIKVVCERASFLLLSSLSEGSRNWFQSLQDSIKQCQNSHPDSSSRLTLKRNICLRAKIAPFTKRSVTNQDDTEVLNVENINFSPLQVKSSFKRKLARFMACS